MEENVSPNQGRDNMVDQFPDLFEIGEDEWSESGEPRLKLREGVDENEALQKVNNKLEFENGQLKSLDLSDENVEKALIENSRIQLAKQRQQLMASIVLMGINRIVVTDGRISAKIIYDVRSAGQRIDAQARNARWTWRATGSATSRRPAPARASTTAATSAVAAAVRRRDYNAEYFAKGEYQV